jgi:hypothetical protein
MTSPSMDSDLVDPTSEDWTQCDDAALWHAAQAGVPQAVAEQARREREHTPPITAPPE